MRFQNLITARAIAAIGAALLALHCATPVPIDKSAPSTATPAASGLEASTAPPAADELFAVSWQQSAAEYDALTRTVYGLARLRLDEALATPAWDALPRIERERAGVPAEGLPPAVILDIDETVLDNSPSAVDLLARPLDESLPPDAYRTAVGRRWKEWSDRAHATRMPGVKDFLDYAASKRVEIFYVTNRANACEEAATCKNLADQHLPLKDCESNVLLRKEQAPWLQDREKGSRRIEIGKKYRVLLLIGDNLGDFVDGIYGDGVARSALLCTERTWWGERWLALPNPSYG